MKKLIFTLLIILQGGTASILAQTTPKSNSDLSAISRADIVGLWQINSPQVGANLLENFRFFKDGTFVYNYEPEDDTRNIVQLKGKYRLDDDRLYFTITSAKARVGGGIEAGALGTDSYLFVYNTDSTKVIRYKNPKELTPLSILNVKKSKGSIHMDINNRSYYKLSSNPNKFSEN